MGVGERYKLMHLLAQEMIRRFRVEPKYLVFNEAMSRYLLEKGIPAEEIIHLNEKIRFGSWGNEPVDEGFLREMEDLYGIPNLYLYWEAVRTYEGYDQYSALKMIEAVFRAYRSFLDQEAFDFALMDTFPASMPMMAMSTIMEQKQTPFYFLIPSRIEKRFLIVHGIKDKYHRIDGIFDRLKERELTEEERAAAEAFISKYHQGKRYFSTSERAVFKKRDISFARLRRGVGALIDSYRYGMAQKSYRKHSTMAPLQYAAGRIRAIFGKRRLASNPLFQDPVEGDRYVLFLLHKQPEATTFVKSPFFMDQRYLLEIIAKSLPIGYSLYVKPHHNDFGNLPASYYRNLVCRPNIRMLKVGTNSQDLVRNCSAVLTISGTVGWEGIILGKPVITFGRVFYNHFDQVTHVRDVAELPRLLKEAVSDYRPDPELMLKYVSAHIQGTHDGVPLSPVYTEGASLSPENISKIADGIEKDLHL